MSFRLYIYYCALLGGAGAFMGWALGLWLAPPSGVVSTGVKALWLGVGIAVTLSLLDALWSFSLRQVVAVGSRVLVACAVSAVAGILGGTIMEALMGWIQSKVFQVMAWIFIGLLIGGSLGAFELAASIIQGQSRSGAFRKVRNGLLGGAVGGLLGCSLMVWSRGAWGQLFQNKDESALWSPSLSGFLILGACIGLLIALAQIILKEAWLRVESGFRPGRELILTRPEVTIGRAEGCDVGLFGDPTVEKVHVKITRQNEGYVIEDAGSATGTFVNDQRIAGRQTLRSGDQIRLGRNVLRFSERQKRS